MTDGLLLISPVSSRDGVNAGGGFEIQHHLPRRAGFDVLVLNLVFNSSQPLCGECTAIALATI